uniref:Uncharacterized protein n=1 Tax=Castor canadensis TaxID=51338 RepID=A0A8C0XEN1_CASCN
MPCETHNVEKQNFCNNIEGHSIDIPKKRMSNFINKNLKFKKSPKQLSMIPPSVCWNVASWVLVPSLLI